MRVGFDVLDDLQVSSDVRETIQSTVSERIASSMFAGVDDLRLRLRKTKGALLCVAMVGFAGGALVTSTATSESPLEAVSGALDGLPERIDRAQRSDRRSSRASDTDRHAAVRDALKKLLDRG